MCLKEKTIAERLAEKGLRLNTWANAKGLSKKDKQLLMQISSGRTQGKFGRSKELLSMVLDALDDQNN